MPGDGDVVGWRRNVFHYTSSHQVITLRIQGAPRKGGQLYSILLHKIYMAAAVRARKNAISQCSISESGKYTCQNTIDLASWLLSRIHTPEQKIKQQHFSIQRKQKQNWKWKDTFIEWPAEISPLYCIYMTSKILWLCIFGPRKTERKISTGLDVSFQERFMALHISAQWNVTWKQNRKHFWSQSEIFTTMLLVSYATMCYNVLLC